MKKGEKKRKKTYSIIVHLQTHTQYNNNNEEEEGETAIAERRKTAATAAVAMRKNEKSFLIKNLY